jgi:hypothetical protein
MGLIRSAIHNWPSSGKRLSVCAAATVIQPHDLADPLLERNRIVTVERAIGQAKPAVGT